MTGSYLAAIENALLQGTGRGLMLSALDLQYVRQWARAKVPVEVVVAGIENAFSETRKRTGRGLAYAAPAVQDAIKAWTERKVGAPSSATGNEEDVLSALNSLMNRWVDAGLRNEPPVRFVLRDSWRALRDLRRRCTRGEAPDVVDALKHLIAETCNGLWTVVTEEQRAQIHRSVEESLLGEFASASELENLRTVRRWQALRTQLGLPNLALEIGGGW